MQITRCFCNLQLQIFMLWVWNEIETKLCLCVRWEKKVKYTVGFANGLISLGVHVAFKRPKFIDWNFVDFLELYGNDCYGFFSNLKCYNIGETCVPKAWSMWNYKYYRIVDTKQRNSLIVIIVIRPGPRVLPFSLSHGPKQIVPYRSVFREESKIQVYL